LLSIVLGFSIDTIITNNSQNTSDTKSVLYWLDLFAKTRQKRYLCGAINMNFKYATDEYQN